MMLPVPMIRLFWCMPFVLMASVACTGSRTEPPGEVVRQPAEPRQPYDLSGDATNNIEAISLLGAALVRAEMPDNQNQQLEADLQAARVDSESQPGDEMATIWYGRCLGYLGRYRDALAVFTGGLVAHPGSYKLRRHAGHRLITLRRFDDAVAHLTRAGELVQGLADEVEPDGAPNPFNRPRSTTQSNIWYHLGLAHYLLGDYEAALAAYVECRWVSANDDMLCATLHWQYTALRRLGRDAEAIAVLEPVHEDMEILENDAYHALLLMYKGERTLEEVLAEARQDDLNFASAGYGVANWLWCEGQPERAMALCREIVENTNWAAFGHIAAEAELARER